MLSSMVGAMFECPSQLTTSTAFSMEPFEYAAAFLDGMQYGAFVPGYTLFDQVSVVFLTNKRVEDKTH